MTQEEENNFDAFLSRIGEEKKKGRSINISASYLKDFLMSLEEKNGNEDEEELLLWLNIAGSFYHFFKNLSLVEKDCFREDAKIIYFNLRERSMKHPILFSERELLAKIEKLTIA